MGKQGHSEQGRTRVFVALVRLHFLMVISALVPVMAEAEAPLVNIVTKVQSARAQALGGAGVAMSNDLTMVWTTPVAAAPAAQWALCIGAARGSFGEMTSQTLMGFPAWGIYIFGGGGYYDTGSVTLNASDGSSRKVTGQSDFMGLFGIAGETSEGHRQGIQVKVFRSDLLEEFTTYSVAVDFGAQVDWSDFVTAGVAIQNFGPNVKFDEDTISQPSLARAGLALRFPLGEHDGFPTDAPSSLLIDLDAEYSPSRYRLNWYGGAELTLGGMLILRGGGSFGPTSQLGKVTAGIGVNIKTEAAEYARHYRLDYTCHFLTEGFDMPHAVSLTCLF